MKTTHIIAIFSGLLLIVAGCNKPERFSHTVEKDSLKSIMIAHNSLVQSVNEANLILDSIDQIITAPQQIKKDESISSRLQKLSRHVKATEQRIIKVERALYKSRNEASAYFLMMDALKDEVRIRDEELQILSDSIARGNAVFSSASLVKTK